MVKSNKAFGTKVQGNGPFNMNFSLPITFVDNAISYAKLKYEMST